MPPINTREHPGKTDLYYMDRDMAEVARFKDLLDSVVEVGECLPLVRRRLKWEAKAARGEDPGPAPVPQQTQVEPGVEEYQWIRAKKTVLWYLLQAEDGSSFEEGLRYWAEKYRQEARLAGEPNNTSS